MAKKGKQEVCYSVFQMRTLIRGPDSLWFIKKSHGTSRKE